jgi:hypothetical protein
LENAVKHAGVVGTHGKSHGEENHFDDLVPVIGTTPQTVKCLVEEPKVTRFA